VSKPDGQKGTVNQRWLSTRNRDLKGAITWRNKAQQKGIAESPYYSWGSFETQKNERQPDEE